MSNTTKTLTTPQMMFWVRELETRGHTVFVAIPTGDGQYRTARLAWRSSLYTPDATDLFDLLEGAEAAADQRNGTVKPPVEKEVEVGNAPKLIAAPEPKKLAAPVETKKLPAPAKKKAAK